MRILGLDPGNAITGYGMIEEAKGDYTLVEYGTLRTPSGLDAGRRLLLLYEALQKLLDKLSPEQVAVEQLLWLALSRRH